MNLVRDHVTTLADLGKDWASGPASDFNTWIPMIYAVQLEFQDYDVNLFVNDHNIIDYPSDPDENGRHLAATFHLLLSTL